MNIEDNIFKVGHLTFEAIGNRTIIREDEFHSGYECAACKGKGSVECAGCKGSGISSTVAHARCSHCEGAGNVTCRECDGKGGLLIVSEQSQRRPTSGVVMSVGPDAHELTVGDSVLYSNFAGYVVDLETAEGPTCLRILHENEILARMTGQLELRTLKGKSEIATFNN